MNVKGHRDDRWRVEPGRVADDELESFDRCFWAAVGAPFDRQRRAWRRDVAEEGRGWAVEADGSIVGVADSYRLEMTVPGGSVPTLAVSGVGVLPSHRRRGIMSALLRSQLNEALDRNEPIATLWASDSELYGRYGFGIASREYTLDFDPRAVSIIETAEVTSVAEVDAATAAQEFPAVYDRWRVDRVGAMSRSPRWWTHRVLAPRPGSGPAPLRFALCRANRASVGYLIYRIHPAMDGRVAVDRLEVVEMIAVDPDAERGLWRWCLETDLLGKITASHRPLDDTLLLLASQHRRISTQLSDALWVRLVDIEAALAMRTYADPDCLVFEVIDGFLPHNARRYRLEIEARGSAACSKTDGDADIELEVDALARCFLGDLSFSQLGAAGYTTEHVPGALARADRAFMTSRAPWCPQLY